MTKENPGRHTPNSAASYVGIWGFCFRVLDGSTPSFDAYNTYSLGLVPHTRQLSSAHVSELPHLQRLGVFIKTAFLIRASHNNLGGPPLRISPATNYRLEGSLKPQRKSAWPPQSCVLFISKTSATRTTLPSWLPVWLGPGPWATGAGFCVLQLISRSKNPFRFNTWRLG